MFQWRGATGVGAQRPWEERSCGIHLVCNCLFYAGSTSVCLIINVEVVEQ